VSSSHYRLRLDANSRQALLPLLITATSSPLLRAWKHYLSEPFPTSARVTHSPDAILLSTASSCSPIAGDLVCSSTYSRTSRSPAPPGPRGGAGGSLELGEGFKTVLLPSSDKECKTRGISLDRLNGYAGRYGRCGCTLSPPASHHYWFSVPWSSAPPRT